MENNVANLLLIEGFPVACVKFELSYWMRGCADSDACQLQKLSVCSGKLVHISPM